MVEKVKALLQGRSKNHLAPFFWQHGENEAALRNTWLLSRAAAAELCAWRAGPTRTSAAPAGGGTWT